ncbi:hypothetical protein [Methylocella tundrae]|uniref:hypothetical protein n=1 Tax=Methylocella tundrae TaxID=227605 RepID=UPI00106A43A7|nr:hypothetical protein [Methylocella tundrae]
MAKVATGAASVPAVSLPESETTISGAAEIAGVGKAVDEAPEPLALPGVVRRVIDAPRSADVST